MFCSDAAVHDKPLCIAISNAGARARRCFSICTRVCGCKDQSCTVLSTLVEANHVAQHRIKAFCVCVSTSLSYFQHRNCTDWCDVSWCNSTRRASATIQAERVHMLESVQYFSWCNLYRLLSSLARVLFNTMSFRPLGFSKVH